MTFSEPGSPYFRWEEGEITSTKPFAGARLTSAGLYRQFPITHDSPHEPWCLHFEWGPCNCGPRAGEVFMAQLESQVVFDGHTPESHPEEYGWIGYGLDRSRLWRWVRSQLGRADG